LSNNKYIFSIVLLFVSSHILAQRTAIKDSIQPGTTIVIISAKRYNFQDKDTLGKFISLGGDAKVSQDKTFFDADSIVINQKENYLEAFGNVHINDADSVHTYANYIKYLGKEKRAFLKDNIKLTDGKGILTTNDLVYDVGIKMGTYKNGGKLVNGKTVLTSKDGYYYGDTKDVYFKNNVVMINPEYKIYTDTLLYNMATDIATFVAPTTIYNGNRKIITKDGFYNLKTKKAMFGKRTVIDDSSYTFVADDIAFEDSTGRGEYRGNAVYRSKSAKDGFDLIANNIKTNSKTNTFLATEKPILFIKQAPDTIFITADTLFSGKYTDAKKHRDVTWVRDSAKGKQQFTFTKDSSNNRFFEGYKNVKIFHDSIQVVADSMFYSSVDSVFRLFYNPIVWSKDNQITGDTMYLFVKNKQPEKLLVFEHAMAISKVNASFFNQMRGNKITGFFKDEKIDVLITKGSPAENIYYAEDEGKKLVGVNKSTSDVINIKFANNAPQKVTFINNLQGTMYPVNQVNHDDIKVKGFKWLIDLRPKSRFDILGG
jgi:lipopolysaccharide export system protein LptA